MHKHEYENKTVGLKDSLLQASELDTNTKISEASPP